MVMALIVLPADARADSGGIDLDGGIDPQETSDTTTETTTPPTGETAPGSEAQLVDGKAIPPVDAPPRVVRAIEAANRIEEMPYEYGGGHAGWRDRGYDCSGAVSYALGKPGARVLDAPMASGGFMRWEERGAGEWITTYANPGHMYVVIAGLRWDTSNTPGDGPGWSETGISKAGYKVRHPAGF